MIAETDLSRTERRHGRFFLYH